MVAVRVKTQDQATTIETILRTLDGQFIQTSEDTFEATELHLALDMAMQKVTTEIANKLTV